jgi:Glycoside hydrolase family 44
LRSLVKRKLKFLAWLSVLLCSLLLGACGDNSSLSNVERTTPNSVRPTANATTVSGSINSTATVGQTQGSAATATKKPGTVVLKVDQTKVLHEISPLIYGLAGGDDNNNKFFQEIGAGMFRWGGNANTRYNWVVGNAWNAARDWEFRNTSYGSVSSDGKPLYVAADAISYFKDNNMPVLLTIPTIGWVAKNGDDRVFSQNVPANGNAPVQPGSEAIQGYDPTANRQRTSVQSKARKGAPFTINPNPNSPIIYQDEWVYNLVQRFGTAAQGGVQFYAMDNEPDLWAGNHTDVHPVRMGYDAVRDRFFEYATAVKDVDPTAKVTGPVVSGWTSFFYSELDRSNDNFRTAADRRAHGNQPFIAWFLEEARKHEERTGRRTLDVLDIHYYPQAPGVFEGQVDPETNALRLRSTRSLWDKSYRDESWIREPVALIPLMRNWINGFYPGTKLGITEWNWGADDTLNGALAIANVLGIFGRENVYMAAYWRHPPSGSPGLNAFRFFTNFDGKGTRFGTQAISTVSTDYDTVELFAAIDPDTKRMRLIMINFQPDKSAPVEIQLASGLKSQTANVYQMSAETKNAIATRPGLPVSGSSLTLDLPAYSITLLEVEL